MKTNSTLMLRIRKLSLREVKCPIRLISPEKVILDQNLYLDTRGKQIFPHFCCCRNISNCLGQRLPSLLQVLRDRLGSLHCNSSSCAMGCCQVLLEVFFLLLTTLDKAAIKHYWDVNNFSQLLRIQRKSHSGYRAFLLTCCHSPTTTRFKRGHPGAPLGGEIMRGLESGRRLPLGKSTIFRGRSQGEGHNSSLPKAMETRPTRTVS